MDGKPACSAGIRRECGEGQNADRKDRGGEVSRVADGIDLTCPAGDYRAGHRGLDRRLEAAVRASARGREMDRAGECAAGLALVGRHPVPCERAGACGASATRRWREGDIDSGGGCQGESERNGGRHSVCERLYHKTVSQRKCSRCLERSGDRRGGVGEPRAGVSEREPQQCGLRT